MTGLRLRLPAADGALTEYRLSGAEPIAPRRTRRAAVSRSPRHMW